jgi:anti-sigma factor RsiW
LEHDRYRTKLSAYCDGELPADFMREISLHLQGCAACRKEVDEMARIDSLIRGLPEFDVSEEFASPISRGIMAEADLGAASSGNLLRRFLMGFLQLAEAVFGMFPGYGNRRTAALDEFGDFPPLSLSYAYFQVIGR